MRAKFTIAAIFLLVSCGFISLFGISGKANAGSSNYFTSDDAVNKLFEKNCSSCHGSDGRAKTFKAKFNHARDLTDAKWQAEATDARLVDSITNGKGKMPAFGKKLTADEINSLVAHVRTLKG